MKSYLFLLFTAFVLFNLSNASVNYGSLRAPKIDLENHLEALNPLLDWFHELNEIHDKVASIRQKVPSSHEETAAIMDMFNKVNMTKACNTCQKVITTLRKASNNKIIEKYVLDLAFKQCKKNYNESVCIGMIDSFGDIVYQSAMDETLNPVHVCEGLSMCPKTTKFETIKHYVEDILKDQPSKTETKPTKKSTYTILQLSDPHVDLEYVTGTNANCGSSICCRAESGAAPKTSDAAQYWGSIAKCDIPLRTFEQFAKFVSSKFDIDMLIWTGDNIAHNIWNQTQETQTDNTLEITKVLMQYFPNTQVYPMFGNHEAFPSDQFDTSGNKSQWLLDSLSVMWKDWLDADALKEFQEKSYYATVHPKFNVKVIAMDTQACDTEDYYLLRNPTDPMNELKWLREQLYDSEKKNQGVFIMGHIPPGNHACYSQWAARYRAIIERFQNIIRGQFFGHTHADELEVVRSYKDHSAVGAVFIAPSFTTFSNHLPSFRIFEVDAETNVLLNMKQYSLDLRKWNKFTEGPIEFDLTYDFLSEYGVPDLSPKSVDHVVDRIKSDPELAKTYNFHRHTGGKKVNLDDRVTQHLYCNAKYSVSADALVCLGLDATTKDVMQVAKQLLPGVWYYDQC